MIDLIYLDVFIILFFIVFIVFFSFRLASCSQSLVEMGIYVDLINLIDLIDQINNFYIFRRFSVSHTNPSLWICVWKPSYLKMST